MKRKKGTKVTLYYNFNTSYRDGKDSIKVNKQNYPYDVFLTKKELQLPVQEVYDLYSNDALESAAYDTMSDYADTMWGGKRVYKKGS